MAFCARKAVFRKAYKLASLKAFNRKQQSAKINAENQSKQHGSDFDSFYFIFISLKKAEGKRRGIFLLPRIRASNPFTLLCVFVRAVKSRARLPPFAKPIALFAVNLSYLH